MFCSFIKKYFDSSEIDHPISVICFPLKKCYIFFIIFINLNDVLVGCVLHPIDSEVIYRRHPHLLSLAKGHEAQLLHHSHRELYPGSSRGSQLHYRCATQAPQ